MARKIKPSKVVKTKTGKYSIQYVNPSGLRRRWLAGYDQKIAFNWAHKFDEWLLNGKDPEHETERAKQVEQAKAINLKQFFPTFIERHGKLQSQSMQARYQDFFKNICRCPVLADCQLGSVSKRLVLDYMRKRMEVDKVTAATVNREAGFMRGMLSRAVEWDNISVNPLKGLKLFKEAEKRKVQLSPTQAEMLLDNLPAALSDIVEFALYTGFRKENILSLRIDQLRFHDLQPTGEVELVLKGGKTERFPLSQNAVRVLKQALCGRKEGYVFLNPKSQTRYYSINRTFNRAVDKVGLKVYSSRFRFHDLRHVFATWLHQAGVSLDHLRPLLGHQDRDTTDRYIYLDRKAVGQALDLVPQLRQRKAPAN